MESEYNKNMEHQMQIYQPTHKIQSQETSYAQMVKNGLVLVDAVFTVVIASIIFSFL